MIKRQLRRPGCWLPLLILLVLLVWLLFVGWQLYSAATTLRGHAYTARALVSNPQNIHNARPKQFDNIINGSREEIERIKRTTAPFMWLTPWLGWVPRVGPLIEDSQAWLEIADAGSLAAVELLPGLKKGLTAAKQAGKPPNSLAALAPLVGGVIPYLPSANDEIDQVTAAYQQIENRDALPEEVQSFLPILDRLLPLQEEGLLAAQLVPELLGTNGRRTFLILAQNPWELRATGGYVGGVGTLIIENGDILSFEFTSSNGINYRDGAFVPNSESYDYPPTELQDFMLLPYWFFQDANYFPDFPTSAEKAIELYALGMGVEADGVFAVDLFMLEKLLSATGPIAIPDSDIAFDESNVVSQLQAAWGDRGDDSQEWLASRGNYLKPFADALLYKLTSDVASLDPAKLLTTLFKAAEQKHVQIYMRDEAATAALTQLGWDGRMVGNPGGDMLRIVETNVGYNKTNAIMVREVNYAIELHDNDTSIASLAIKWTNNAPADGQACTQHYDNYLQVEFSDLVARCYYNFLRLYLPPNSFVTGATAHPADGSVFVSGKAWDGMMVEVLPDAEGDGIDLMLDIDDDGKTAAWKQFKTFVLVPKGQSVTSNMTYALTGDLIETVGERQQYTLLLPKQAGMETTDFLVTVELPETADTSTLIANAPFKSRFGHTLTFEIETDVDFELVVSWEE